MKRNGPAIFSGSDFLQLRSDTDFQRGAGDSEVFGFPEEKGSQAILLVYGKGPLPVPTTPNTS